MALSALEEKQSPISAFADDIDGLAGEEEEQAKLVEHLDNTSTASAMEISAKRTIIIIINPITVRVVGAPQMILQPVFSIFPCSPLPSGTCRTPGL